MLYILAQPNSDSLFNVHLHLVPPFCLFLYLFPRYQRFLSDYDELSGWMEEKTALINADELPTDVTGGEALLDRHQQHKVERKGLPKRRKREVTTMPELFLLHFNTVLSCGHSMRLTLMMTDFNLLMRLAKPCWMPIMKHLVKFGKR